MAKVPGFYQMLINKEEREQNKKIIWFEKNIIKPCGYIAFVLFIIWLLHKISPCDKAHNCEDRGETWVEHEQDKQW